MTTLTRDPLLPSSSHTTDWTRAVLIFGREPRPPKVGNKTIVRAGQSATRRGDLGVRPALRLTWRRTPVIVLSMNFDISPLLEEWEYQSGQIGVRQFKGKDGVQKIQLRVDLGVLQMNAHGRPDGKTPYGYESLLEYFESRLAKHRKGHEGSDGTFELSWEDCWRVQQEGIQ